MKKMKKTIAMITLISLSSLSLSFCSTTTVNHVKPERLTLEETVLPDKITIRVYKDDTELCEEYVKKLREQVEFHNKQVRRANKLCNS